jgi:hypothetical protein
LEIRSRRNHFGRGGAKEQAREVTVWGVEVGYLIVLIVTLVAIAGVAARYLLDMFSSDR